MHSIIDKFISEKDIFTIKNTFFSKEKNISSGFSWNYQRGIVNNPDLSPTGYEDNDWIYVHSLYDSENGEIRDDYYHLVLPILNKLSINKLFDIRANLLVPTKEHIYHKFHVDRKIPHKVGLFYVTTCNGFTILRNNKVNCVENRMLIFDGSVEHCSVTSTDNVRCVININYI